MNIDKWHMHRIGLVDFWFYTNEEFYFADGHMLLRGSNGSGKSVTMQSFIPLLLDGNKSSERLDAFGSRARKMESYLLDEAGKYDNRIGYLYLEFKKGNSDLYTTIGMGMHARKNKPLDTWYFVIEDNRRINRDFSLIEANKTLTKRELRNRIGNQYIDQQRQYMDKVNQVLFGFENVIEYKETIDLLLQLRAPKLSNSFKPTMLNEVLSNSLQPLTEEDLRPMSDAISSMDDNKDQLDILKESIRGAEDIMNVYQEYNHAVLFDKLQKYKREEAKQKELTKEIEEAKKQQQTIMQETKLLKEKETTLRQEQRVLQAEKETLATQDMIRLQEEIHQLSIENQRSKKNLETKESQYQHKDNKYMDKKNAKVNYENTVYDIHKELVTTMEEMDSIYEEWPFHEHLVVKKEVMPDLSKKYNYSYTIRQLEDTLTLIQESKSKLEALTFYQKKYKEIENQKTKIQDIFERKEYELTENEKLYQDIIEEYKEKITKWNSSNTYLSFSEKEIQQIISQLLHYEETKDYQIILAMLESLKQQHKEQKQVEIVKEEANHNQIKKELVNIEKELLSWQNKQEVQPDLAVESKNNREFLKEHNIPFLSFYEILDFDDTMTTKNRNKIEEILHRTGLLDALLVEEQYRDFLLQYRAKMFDTYLFINRSVTQLQPIFLSADKTLRHALIEIGCTAKYYLEIEEHYFKIGALEGTLLGNIEARYVGKETREKHRQERIASLQEEKRLEEEKLEVSMRLLSSYQEALVSIDAEYQDFPREADLRSAISIIDTLHYEIQQIQEKVKQVEQEMFHIRKSMQPIQQVIQEAANTLSIEMKQSAFLTLETQVRAYREQLTLFTQKHNEYMQVHIMFQQVSEQVEDLIEEIDVLHSEIDILKQRITEKEEILVLKNKKLEEIGYHEVKQRLEIVIARLEEIPTEIENTVGKTSANNVEQENLETKITMNSHALEIQNNRVTMYYEILDKEVSLALVIKEEWSVASIETLQKQYSGLRMMDTLHRQLQDKYYAKMVSLQEYHLSLIDTLANPYPEIEDISARLFITAKYTGTKMGLDALMQQLVQDQKLLENLLQEADRELFEEILISTISKKIRYRIQNSRQWIETMNGYMNAMQTSSSLKLQLLWKPHKAIEEEQLDTRELVKLLLGDEKLLTNKDKAKVTNHFRSKIQQARKLSNQEGTFSSFHQIMREIMDYRKWFTFTIMFEKVGENKKELTNNAFSVFSGGEKAMSMYVPLFSAVAAKFDSARKEAPVIIALDEAFAGVDERNIDTMFALIQKFGFDYIMNSQVLWGDYPSVSALSIYELYRPNNATYVTVMQYRWNGHTKEYIERN